MRTNMETILEALTPPDRTDVSYRHVDSQDSHEGLDRSFWFDVPTGGEPQAERGNAMTEYQHNVVIRLRLMAEGYTQRTLFNRVANEAVLFIRAIDKAAETSWGSGVLNVITNGYTTDRVRDEVVVSMPITAHVEETD